MVNTSQRKISVPLLFPHHIKYDSKNLSQKLNSFKSLVSSKELIVDLPKS